MELFNDGFLSNLSEKVITGVKVEKLTSNDLYHIATVLGQISRTEDLYDVLFDKPNMMVTSKFGSVFTRDLGMFILMEHSKPRSFFAKTAGSNACVDLFMSQGVPLAFEGAKRLYGKTYNDWYIGEPDVNITIKCDIFLPNALASLELDPVSGEVTASNLYGLIRLRKNDVVFSPETISYIKENTPGWVGKHNPKKIDNTNNTSEVDIYNKCAPKLRAMILQGWIWGKQLQLNSDMITDIHDWDATAEKHSVFSGMAPQITNIGAFFK